MIESMIVLVMLNVPATIHEQFGVSRIESGVYRFEDTKRKATCWFAYESATQGRGFRGISCISNKDLEGKK